MSAKEQRLASELERAVKNYEGNAGMDAVNYRALPKDATLKEKLDAARRDVAWWEDHSHEVSRVLDRSIGSIRLEIEA